MFIELTNKKRKILFPLSSITVRQFSNGKAAVQVIGGKEWAVEESYESIIEAITTMIVQGGRLVRV